MQDAQMIRLLPTLRVIAETFVEQSLDIVTSICDNNTSFLGARRYHGQTLHKDILYVITTADTATFPVNEYVFVSPDLIEGAADHICCPGSTAAELLEYLLDLFLEFRETESRINSLVYRNGTLSQLCELGEELLENAVFIHDNWFLLLARSRSAESFMPPSASPWELIPQSFLDDFRLDDDYQKTYYRRGAELWEANAEDRQVQTIYVNLYDEEIYRGRLLVTDIFRKFKCRDYIIAEVLAQQALALLKAKRHGSNSTNRSTDDIVQDILNGTYTDASEFSTLMNTLGWEKSDRFQCIRIQSQESQPVGAIDYLLHKDLFLAYPGSYIMFAPNQQCVIINLRRTPYTLSDVRHVLSPLCRDYYQYGGVSSPVEGIRELPIAYHQAGEALEQAFRRRDEQWIIPFHSCALDYTLMHLNTPMQLRHLVAPQLLTLIQHDREKGSQLFETFKTYLNNERDIPRTSTELIIHRTTLTYRLQKIVTLLNMDLNDPNVRLYLLLSLKMLEQERTVKLSETSNPDIQLS